MDFLSKYDDDEDGDATQSAAAPLVPTLLSARAAPGPRSDGLSATALALLAPPPLPASVTTTLSLCGAGKGRGLGPPGSHHQQRTLIGTLVDSTLHPEDFAAQYAQFESRGVCAAADGSSSFVGSGAGGLSLGAGARFKRPRDLNNDASSSDYLGPWAGWAGEADRAKAALSFEGGLTLSQQLIRVGQGLHPTQPGKLEGEELTTTTLRLQKEKALVDAGGGGRQCKRNEAFARSASGERSDP